MKPAPSATWLLTTVNAVREVMVRRLEADSLDGETKRDLEMALEELDVMWEELQAQAAVLERENERYAEFFDYAPDAYVITDVGGNLREVNHAACELFGVSREALLGKPLSAYVADGDRVAFLSRSVNLVFGASLRPESWRARILRHGAITDVEFTVRAIPLRKSGVGGICWLIRPSG